MLTQIHIRSAQPSSDETDMNLDGKTLLHRMKLRGPWGICDPEFEETPLGGFPSTVKIPVSWQEVFGRNTGTATFTRHFNRPTGLEETDQVWLALLSPAAQCEIRMDKRPLSSSELKLANDQAWTVSNLTPELHANNRLRVKLSTQSAAIESASPVGLWAAPELWIIGTEQPQRARG